jgi:hypothetical protein
LLNDQTVDLIVTILIVETQSPDTWGREKFRNLSDVGPAVFIFQGSDANQEE